MPPTSAMTGRQPAVQLNTPVAPARSPGSGVLASKPRPAERRVTTGTLNRAGESQAERFDGAPAGERENVGKRNPFKSPIVLGSASLAVVVIGIMVGFMVLHNLTPPDRSSPAASITGYYTALQSRHYSHAFDYLTESQTNPGDKATVLSGLTADDQQYGRVLSAHIVNIENDGGKATAQVTVTRALAPNAPQTLSIELTLYSGDTWLIDSVATT